ncbi:hypothetical protein FJZ36_12475 [Candidatus Poribacteria bacterium]|nr:hypothetical protein [Candidatus Poribacteria bacterium]
MRRTPLGALLLLAALAPWFTATAATVSAPDIQMEQGAQARFVVGIDDAAGLSITALDIVLAYDARLVVAELVDTSGAVGSGWLAAYNLLPGEILISIAGARPIARNGPLFSVWFTATKERLGTSPVTFTRVRINEGLVDHTIRNGSIEVIPPAPVPISQSNVPVAEGASVNVNLSAVDTTGNPLTYTLVESPIHGILSGAPPNLVYRANRQPTVGFQGADRLRFTVNNTLRTSEPAEVTFAISPINDPPVAADASATTVEESSVRITLSATDADGDVLTFTVIVPPAHGALTGSAPDLTYAPATDYAGTDEFRYVANDGVADSAGAVVRVTITPVNDAPTFDKIADVSIPSDGEEHTITVTGVSPGGGEDEASQTVTLTATSADPARLPNPTVAGSGASRTLTLTPVVGASGDVVVTVVCRDSGSDTAPSENTTSQTFRVTLTPPLTAFSSATVVPNTARKAGTQIVVTAQVRYAASVTFSVRGAPNDQNVAMSREGAAAPRTFERWRGTYTVAEKDPVVILAPVVVTAKSAVGVTSEQTAEGTVIFRPVTPKFQVAALPPVVKDGDTIRLSVSGEAGATVTADVTSIQPGAATIALASSGATSYAGTFVVPARLTVEDGDKLVRFTITDRTGVVVTDAAAVRLDTGSAAMAERARVLAETLAGLRSEAGSLTVTRLPLAESAVTRAQEALASGDLSTARTEIAAANDLLRSARSELNALRDIDNAVAALARLQEQAGTVGVMLTDAQLSGYNAAIGRAKTALSAGSYGDASAAARDAMAALDALRATLDLTPSAEEIEEQVIRKAETLASTMAQVSLDVAWAAESGDARALAAAMADMERVADEARRAREAGGASSAAVRELVASTVATSRAVADAAETIAQNAAARTESARPVFASQDLSSRRAAESVLAEGEQASLAAARAALSAAENARLLAEIAESTRDPNASELRRQATEAQTRAVVGTVTSLSVSAEAASLVTRTDALDVKKKAADAKEKPIGEAQALARAASRITTLAKERADRATTDAKKADSDASDSTERAKSIAAAAMEFAGLASEAAAEVLAAAKQAGKRACDLDDDGKNDISDLTRIAETFGEPSADVMDINGDGSVDILDLVVAALAFSEAGVLIPVGTPSAPHRQQSDRIQVRLASLNDGRSALVLSGVGLGSMVGAQVSVYSMGGSTLPAVIRPGRVWSEDGGTFFSTSLPSESGSAGMAIVRLSAPTSDGDGVLATIELVHETVLRHSAVRVRVSVINAQGIREDVDMPVVLSAGGSSQSAVDALRNFPDPFNAETWIPFALDRAADVSVHIYDMAGRLVRRLALGAREPGIYATKALAAYWDGESDRGEPVASGPYYYEVRVGSRVTTGKMVVAK